MQVRPRRRRKDVSVADLERKELREQDVLDRKELDKENT